MQRGEISALFETLDNNEQLIVMHYWWFLYWRRKLINAHKPRRLKRWLVVTLLVAVIATVEVGFIFLR